MKILWLSTGLFKDRYGKQNYESYLLEAICQLYKGTRNFKILLLNDIGAPSQQEDCSEVSFIYFGNKNRLFSKLKFVLFSLRYIIEGKPDLLVCGHINLSVLCLIFSYLFKIRYILLSYGAEAWNIKGIFKKAALKRASIIATMSSYTASKIKKQIPLLNQKILVIPPPIDTQKFFLLGKPGLLLKKYNLNGSKIILTVARLSSAEDKGYYKVIRIMPALIKVIPEIKYFIIGGGDDIPNVINLVDRLGLRDKVIITDFIPHGELTPYYNLCDCFVMPSKQEGFGIVFLEALACGKPVIAGNKDGSVEAVLGGELGLLVNPDNLDEIKNAIIKVLNNGVNEKLLDGEYIRKRTIEAFGFDKFNGRVGELLKEIGCYRDTF